MSSFLETWYISLGLATVAVAMSVTTALRIRRVLRAVEGGLKRREQLPEVKGAIEADMRMAALFIVLYAVLLGLLVMGVARAWITLGGLSVHLVVFGILTGPVGMWTRGFEKRLQSLDTSGAEPGVADVYTRWLAEWKKPRLTLSEP